MLTTPESELTERIGRLQSIMKERALDAVVILESADLYYFTGTIQSGTLYVPIEGEPLYLVRKSLARAKAESALHRIVPLFSLRDTRATLEREGYAPPKRVGFEWDVLPVAVFNRYRDLFEGAECVDASSAIRRVRMRKSEFEIARIRSAADQADRIFHHARSILREGMTDIEFAAELELVARRDGHPGIVRMRSFNGVMLYAHVFSGPDSAVPAYLDTPLGGIGAHPSFGQGAGWRRIAPHEPVIVDTGSFYGGYLADQTRVLSLGELPTRLAQAYQDMVKIQQLMQSIVRPGVVWAETYSRCHSLALELGYADHFMGAAGSQAGFIGHGLGIEIDELPILAPAFTKDVFETGMVFAFEPKAVFPGVGAVGIENTYVVRDSGPEPLTYSDESLVVL